MKKGVLCGTPFFLVNRKLCFGSRQLRPHFTQLVFLNLSTGCSRKTIDKKHMFGNFVTGNLSPTKLLHLRFAQVLSSLELNKGTNNLTVFFIRNTNYFDHLHLRHSVDEILNFTGIDILPATNNHILNTTGNSVKSVFGLYRQIA